jgi:GGDEF domain-containing protein
MVRVLHERVLLIGDASRELETALGKAAPGAVIHSVPSLFDGIAELCGGRYTTILVAAEPLERRPEAAVKVLREAAGDARLLLFAHPTLEILSRKMLEFGCDDYLVTPCSAGELEQVFSSPRLRLSTEQSDEPQTAAPEKPPEPPVLEALSRIPIAEILLDAMLAGPHEALAGAVNQINARIAPELELRLVKPGQSAPEIPEGHEVFSHIVRGADGEVATLHLMVPAGQDQASARHALAHVGQLLAKVASLQDRHNRLQRLAITDELTGSYNARYFRHFLSSIVERARKMHFPVTLLLFDIDDFKKYNDQFGHATGDEILRQAAALMRRCTRQHDLVARIGGDEYAVVFWDKEGPRQPRDPRPGVVSRPPQQPLQVFERFKRLIASEEFPLLGQTGKGSLTVSAGLAVFPWDANDPESLIREADKRLMLGAKKNGKNTIQIVGTEESANPQA